MFQDVPASSLLHIAIRFHEIELLPGGLCPHIFGALPMLGEWDPTKSIGLERESSTLWEFCLVLPTNHDELQFKFLLRPKGVHHPCLVEEGPVRHLVGGKLEGTNNEIASFGLVEKGVTNKVMITFPVSAHSEPASPISLAATWKIHSEALSSHGSMVRCIPEVDLDDAEISDDAEIPAMTATFQTSESEQNIPLMSQTLKLKAESPKYIADTAEEPSSLKLSALPMSPSMTRQQSISIRDLVLLGENPKTPVQNAVKNHTETEETIQIDVSPSFKAPLVSLSFSETPLEKSDSMGLPQASGAITAAAIAERLGPKERRRLAIILVGLPARGKTFTASKLTRYLRWLGHDTKHFNVGKYRRHKLGSNQTADFFRPDNPEGVEARNEVAVIAFQDMLNWMETGGQVGIFDATNSTKERRKILLRLAEGRCKVIFLESICNDNSVIERNAREKILNSPDYASMSSVELALEDFKNRLKNYEQAYETVDEGSYIKLIDVVSGSANKMQVNNISGYLPGRIVFFLLNTHIVPRPILLTRHGESTDNVRGRIGGDPPLSGRGEEYATKLSDFVTKRLKGERTASVWTSTLQRTILTARHIHGYPKVQWRALDEINAGVCDGMTYEEIKYTMPEEYHSRKLDKLRYRYPRGESYLDVIQRLEPVIIELERQRNPVVVVAHQAVLRALYAYFMDKPLKEIPHIEMPLHTIIELSPSVTGVTEKRFLLMDNGYH